MAGLSKCDRSPSLRLSEPANIDNPGKVLKHTQVSRFLLPTLFFVSLSLPQEVHASDKGLGVGGGQ